MPAGSSDGMPKRERAIGWRSAAGTFSGPSSASTIRGQSWLMGRIQRS